ncbi:FxsA family protein [Suttonella ornithocola]|uniref:Phage T7 F exclusion suppressor FxsA n=2 Tax=Suttonella ornithocola TaxID=279832 RepID=A0A380MPC8_9GAMM|nr:FxsA family protein [Suttonella ornithocola]SUO94128.1 phage T7 F exclusion suppressor FxsA [Suttonella ornithocola]
MPLLLFFGVWGLLELVVLVAVAGAIGALWTIFLLIISAVIGIWVLRGQQMLFMLRLRTLQLQPNALQEGMYRLLAGVLLILPGFISDALAVCLLIPKLRGLIGLSLLRAFKPDIVMKRFGFGKDVPNNVYEHDGSVEAHRADGTKIEGEFIEHQERK